MERLIREEPGDLAGRRGRSGDYANATELTLGHVHKERDEGRLRHCFLSNSKPMCACDVIKAMVPSAAPCQSREVELRTVA